MVVDIGVSLKHIPSPESFYLLATENAPLAEVTVQHSQGCGSRTWVALLMQQLLQWEWEEDPCSAPAAGVKRAEGKKHPQLSRKSEEFGTEVKSKEHM